MKNKLYLVILFLFIFLNYQIISWQYDNQKGTFFYTIDFTDSSENWYLVDDSKYYNAFFQNKNKNSFIEVTVYDLNSASTNYELLDYIIDRYHMKGVSYDTAFCQYDAVRGEYDFNYKNAKYMMDIVLFKDNYYFYVLMGYSYKKLFDEKKGELKEIIDSCKIYYDNNVVYGNNYEEKQNTASLITQNKIIEKSKTGDGKYFFNVNWYSFNRTFEFLREDLIKAKKELSEIGEYTGNNWNGWGYFNIDLGNDPDYNFTFWKKFYQDMYNKNYYRVNDVCKFFKELADSKKYSAYQFANIILRFIQVIPYERPMNITQKGTGTNILDYFSPNEIADYQKGDCDSKSLFLAIIYRRLGYDAILFHSSQYGHVMVGLNINATGAYLENGGKKYYFVETTYPDWKIGDIPPNMNDLSKWRAVPIK